MENDALISKTETVDTGLKSATPHLDTILPTSQEEPYGQDGGVTAKLGRVGYHDEEKLEIEDVGAYHAEEKIKASDNPRNVRSLQGPPRQEEMTGTLGQQNHEQSQQPTRQKKNPLSPEQQDLLKTGRWGKISKVEIYIAAVVCLVAIVVAVVVGVVIHNNKKNDNSPQAITTFSPTKTAALPTSTPTSAPTLTPATPKEQLTEVLRLIANNSYVNGSMSILSNDVSFYKGKANNTTQPSEVRALSWLLYEDTLRELDGIDFRYALATLYFAWGGFQWKNSTNWLTRVTTCKWLGVSCDINTGNLFDLTLSSNSLVGYIPNEIALLTDLRVIDLSHNHLSGSIPGEAVGSLPLLSILSLFSNDFTGTLPGNLARNNVLQSLFIQFNNISGDFSAYCDIRSGIPLLKHFTLDCTSITCGICCTTENCY